MTERRGEQGFSVATSRVDGTGGGWRGRRRRLTTLLVIAASAAIVALAVLGPRLEQRPNLDLSFLATPTPRPTASPSPTRRPGATPTATPLPPLTRGDGPVPPGTIAVQTDTFRLLDPTAGTVTDGPALGFGQVAIVRSASGAGWTCICFADDLVDTVVSRVLRVVEIDAAGTQTRAAELAVLGPIGADQERPPAINTEVDLTADGTVAIVAMVNRQPDDTFRFSAAGLSLVDRRLSPFAAIGAASAPGPVPTAGPSIAVTPDPGVPSGPRTEVYLDGPHVRIAPDGRVAFVWASLQRQVDDGESPTSNVAWRLDLRPDGSVASVADAPILAAMPTYCGYAGFATADRFVWFCPVGDPGRDPSPPPWALQVIGLDGEAAGRISVAGTGPRYLGEPLFDRANAAVYVWDPVGLILSRIDLRRMRSEQVVFDPAAEVATGIEPGGGTARPDWHDADSPLYPYGYGEIAATRDGARLYLAGFKEEVAPDAQAQASLGIFVVDRATLALVDRWAPTTNYQVLAMALEDRAVAVSSFAGADPGGRPVPWQSTLTLLDPADGRVIVQFGQLGEGPPPLVLER